VCSCLEAVLTKKRAAPPARAAIHRASARSNLTLIIVEPRNRSRFAALDSSEDCLQMTAVSGRVASRPIVPKAGEGREVTLIEIEAIEALAREKNIEIPPELARRNLVTRGVPLNHLVGREFQVGSVGLVGKRLCEPCQYLEALTTKGVLTRLLHRGRLRADIVLGGTIRIGDAVSESEK